MEVYSESRPWVSQSSGCHPSQVKQFNEDAKRAGISCAHYRDDGVLECTSKKSRRQIMELKSQHDKDAGYGDRAPP